MVTWSTFTEILTITQPSFTETGAWAELGKKLEELNEYDMFH